MRRKPCLESHWKSLSSLSLLGSIHYTVEYGTDVSSARPCRSYNLSSTTSSLKLLRVRSIRDSLLLHVEHRDVHNLADCRMMESFWSFLSLLAERVQDSAHPR